jgi:hypothetical protein
MQRPQTIASAHLPPELVKIVGGWRGAFEGAIAPVLFVAANGVGAAIAGSEAALRAAVIVAVAVGLSAVMLRLVQRQSPRQALFGIAGLAVAVSFAMVSGQARDFFRPGIYVDALYCAVLALSALLGQPIIGHLHAAVYRPGRHWQQQHRLRRVFVVATLGWSLVYGVRAATQLALYQADLPEALAVTKLLLGWPLTVMAVAVTVTAVRRVDRRSIPPVEAVGAR